MGRGRGGIEYNLKELGEKRRWLNADLKSFSLLYMQKKNLEGPEKIGFDFRRLSIVWISGQILCMQCKKAMIAKILGCNKYST